MKHDKKRINREYKDKLFRLIFSSKEDMLQLYNAVNETEYDNADELEITTLEDVVYLSMKNDVSFLIGDTMNLYEHQSTYNPNMPIRGFSYLAELYSVYIEKNDYDIYGSSLVKLPMAQYIVFYNGTMEQPERSVLRLSDAFMKKDENRQEPCVEVKAIMLNINLGYNQEIMEKCRKLKEYAQFIALVRKYKNQGMPIKEALEAAIDEAIAEDILKGILVKNRAEVIMRYLYEYDEEKHLKNERALGREEGRKEGIEQGLERGLEQGIQALILDNREEGIPDSRIMEKLQKRFGLTEEQAKKYLNGDV